MEAVIPRNTSVEGKLKVSSNLIRLERDECLLLANSLRLDPVVVRRGRQFIETLLTSLKEQPASLDELKQRWPAETSVFDFLLSYGILVPVSERETATEIVRHTDAEKNKTQGMSLYLLLAQDCNLGCVYCLNGKRTYRKNDRPMMTSEVAFRAVESCAALIAPGGYLEVAMFGGEPLLNWELAKQTIDYTENALKEKYPEVEFRYHITSNLSFLPEDFIEKALTHKMSVLCDIDGEGEVHDRCRPFSGGGATHGVISANVRKLVAAGIPVSLRTTLTALNQDHLEQTAWHHRALGGWGTAFAPLNVVNSDEDFMSDRLIPDVDKMLDSLVRVKESGVWTMDRLFPFNIYRAKLQPNNRSILGCGAPYGNTPVVDVQGNVFPCIYLVGIARYCVGNIMEGTYPDNPVLEKMAADLHVDRREGCKDCSWRYLCGGGCPVQHLAMADQQHISPKARAYCERINCDYTKRVLEVLLWDLATQTAQAIDNETNTVKEETV